MPPRRGRAPAHNRDSEAQRVHGDGALPSAAVALARRPHHIVSRLYPPWGSSSNGTALRTSGVALNITTTANKAGASRSAATALVTMHDGALGENKDNPAHVHGGHGCAGLSARVSGNARGQKVLASAATSSRRAEGRRASTACKRPRSTASDSFAAPPGVKEGTVDGSDDAEAGDGRGKDAFRNGGDEAQRAEAGRCPIEVPADVMQLSSSSSSPSPSPSFSPSPMATERKALKGEACAAEWQAPRLPGAQTATISASVTATAEEILVSPLRLSDTAAPQKPPLPHDTATSASDSNVLFLEDGDRRAWPPNHRSTPSGGARRPARAQAETSVLGELSESLSVTSARPQGPRLSLERSGGDEDPAPQAGCALAESDEKLRGELLDARRTDVTGVSGDRAVLGDGDEDEETGGQRSISCATPSLKPTWVELGGSGVAPLLEGRALGSAGATATFTETLAVQDLSLLPDESRSGAAAAVAGGLSNGDGCERTPLLSSSTDQQTPYSGIASAAVSGRLRDDTPGTAAAEEALLGEGLISPPANRITATPQQVVCGFEETTEDRAGNCSGVAKGAAGPSRVQRKVSVMGGLSPWRTCMSTLSSTTPCVVTGGGEACSRGDGINVPPSPSLVGAAASATAEQPAPPQASLTPSSSSPPSSSLPSTLDDGLWKEGSRAAQANLVDADGVTPDNCLRSLRLEDGGTPVPLAPSVTDAHQETMPIDPFLSTPPQLKRRSPLRAKNASGGCSALLRRSPPCSNRVGASKGGHVPPVPGSRSRSPPHSTEQSTTGEGSTITGADVGAEVLRVGTRVEGRWGRQWFPAVISEAPRNGFVQIEWEEDGSLLHVRLREVRLLPGATDPKRAGVESSSHEHKEGVAAAGGAVATEGEGEVLTATQLVALMEEEDAEDRRHEPELPHIRSFPARGETLSPMTTPAGTRMGRDRGKGGEGNEGNAAACALRVGHARGAAGLAADALNAGGDANSDRGNGVGLSACAADSPLPSCSLVPTSTAQSLLPGEVPPSSLCIFFPQAVRRALLQGEAPPPTSHPSSSFSFRYRAGPATELQRSTELQRILHFLASAGAVVIDSLAQADHMAAQLGDDGEVSTTPFTCRPPLLAAEQLHSAGSPLIHATGTASAVGGGGGKRKTVGRVPLPRRSATSAMAVASEAQRLPPRHFIFLVSSAATFVSGGADVCARRHQPHDVLPDVCLAHALGVSAIHASWLWSIVPGTARVKLPTSADQVELLPRAAQEKSRALDVRSAHGSTTKELQLPLRFSPLAVKDRWLSAKDVAFVVRDDRMEMWLNAAGATVTAESAPSSPSHVTRQSLSRETSRLSTAAASAQGGRSLGSVLPRCRSESSSRSPLLKQPRAERMPDFVYVPDDATAPPNLDRLGSVPVLKVPWLADGIEQHYRHCCSSPSTAEPGLPTPSSLASVWAAMPPTRPPKETHAKRSDTPSQPNRVHPSPSSPSMQTAVADEKRGSCSECVHGSTAAVVSALGKERECEGQHGGDAVHSKSAPQLADCRKESADAAAPSAAPLNTSNANANEDDGDAVGAVRGVVSEEAAAMCLSGGSCALPPPSEPVKGAGVGGLGGAAKERVNTEAEEDIVLRLTGPTGAAAVVVPNAAAPTELSLCTLHPAIALGEDYYFTMSAPPPPAPPPRPPSPSLHGPSLIHFPPLALPATTIVLGRVVDLQVDASPTPLLRQQLWADGAASSFTLSQPHCQCRVTLQLYEPKYISMHVDPRSGEVVHQTTVYLSRRWATVPGTSLLYDTPVYVITRAARPHVYFLEEEEEGEVTVPGMSDGTRHSCLRQQPILGTVSTAPAPDLPYGVVRATMDDVPPTGFHERRSRGALAPSRTSERAGRGSSGGGVDERQRRDWALHAAETMRMTPTCDVPRSLGRGGSAQGASGQRTPKRRAGAVVSEAQREIRAAVLDRHELASQPPTLSSAELARSPPLVAVAAGDSTSPALEVRLARQYQQQTMAPGNSPRPARVLAELPLQLGANKVVLRPNSHISFYPRSSLSLSQRPSGCRPLAPTRNGRPHMHMSSEEDCRNVRQPVTVSAVGPAARTTGEPVHRDDNRDDAAGFDAASDTSEEIILEAPLIGQVELLREVEGKIDIVVHTPQPNSVFGGSKMFRLTPDMIVDASP
ncbi:hypothetical protein GH5_02695 [Leishmania sp. Ghana 2012 LV757]|uniref:hypothetical protein n=1 Tax=Leishmania sp. Ghana 2012 LV757 TaxID=2803181 RepID=UPI001B3DA016|nr:hypothetical protein GH5_02695 [Leishmania sp. Ghana 2012 LV757]